MKNDLPRAGPFAVMDSAKISKVKDGTSNTIFVGEVSMSSYVRPTGDDSENFRGGIGRLRVGADRVLRSCLVAPAAWGAWNHSWVTSDFGGQTLLAADGTATGIWHDDWRANYMLAPVFYANFAMNCEWPSAGSFHAGGAQFCLMDASVRFISETISCGDPAGDNYGRNGNVWTAANTMAGHRDQAMVTWD